MSNVYRCKEQVYFFFQIPRRMESHGVQEFHEYVKSLSVGSDTLSADSETLSAVSDTSVVSNPLSTCEEFDFNEWESAHENIKYQEVCVVLEPCDEKLINSKTSNRSESSGNSSIHKQSVNAFVSNKSSRGPGRPKKQKKQSSIVHTGEKRCTSSDYQDVEKDEKKNRLKVAPSLNDASKNSSSTVSNNKKQKVLSPKVLNQTNRKNKTFLQPSDKKAPNLPKNSLLTSPKQKRRELNQLISISNFSPRRNTRLSSTYLTRGRTRTVYNFSKAKVAQNQNSQVSKNLKNKQLKSQSTKKRAPVVRKYKQKYLSKMCTKDELLQPVYSKFDAQIITDPDIELERDSDEYGTYSNYYNNEMSLVELESQRLTETESENIPKAVPLQLQPLPSPSTQPISLFHFKHNSIVSCDLTHKCCLLRHQSVKVDSSTQWEDPDLLLSQAEQNEQTENLDRR